MVIYGNSFSGGDVTLPPSKSAAHRALFCAALSRGRCLVSHIDASKDMEAALGALTALGVSCVYDREKRQALIDGSRLGTTSSGTLNCLESGNTLRFLVPIAAALSGEWHFVGQGRLPQRPMDVFRDLLPRHGVVYHTDGSDELPLTLSGKLAPGVFTLPGDVSSQFITGLLLALPLLEGDSEIVLSTPLESKGYVNLTLAVLRDFGIHITPTMTGWLIPGGQRYLVRDYAVEGDWSQAAFFLAMAALDPGGSTVRLHGLDPDSVQGDRACVERFREFGLSACWEGGVLTAWNPHCKESFGGLAGCTVDVSQIPDMVPALSVCAALAGGETRFVNAARLRFKESDRLSAMEDAVNAIGGRARSTEDTLIIEGVSILTGGTAQGRNDHRVVMALSAPALRSGGEVRVTDEWSIRKTYPGFFGDFTKLGGSVRVVDLG